MYEKICQWVANRLPRRVIYFSYIRLHAWVMCREYSDKTPDEVTWSMAVKSWEKRHEDKKLRVKMDNDAKFGGLESS